MITVKLGEIISSVEHLRKLSKCKFSGLTLLKLLDILDTCDDHSKKFEEVRVAKIKEFGEEKEDGSVQILPEHKRFPEFIKDLNEVTSMDVSIPFEYLTKDEIEKIECEPEVLMALKWLRKSKEMA